jgi:RimJ/RimL family protein N-acetyltransferase
MFTPIRTARLLIRAMIPDDAPGLAARRSDPEVARYQNWTIPYPLERAESMVAAIIAEDGPLNDEWWMGSVCDANSGEVLGDLVLHLDHEGRTAEIGYTFFRGYWGKGFAVEALEALIAYLFEELEATRVFGMLHPDNPASAMVMERCGLLFEGHTKSSFWLDGEVSDDWIYGMTRPDWEAWRARPRTPPNDVRLVEVTVDNVRAVSGLATHKTQERFVAPMHRSFRDALFPEVIDGAPVIPWMRAVVADDVIVGFVMLALRTEHHPEPYLWRLLIDRSHQRRGIGGRVLDLVEDAARAMGDRTLLVSWGEGKGSPRPFYIARGFEPTGVVTDGETEARKSLA